MSGRRPFGELTRDFTLERRRRIDDMKKELLAEMPWRELRHGKALTLPLDHRKEHPPCSNRP